MASRSTTERTVKTKFDGDASGGIRASRQMERELARLQRETEKRQASFVSSVDSGASRVLSSLGKMTTGILAIGSAAGSAQGLAGATAAVATMSGTLLAAPGIALAAGAGYGVLALALSGVGDAIVAKDVEEFTELTKDMAPAAVAAAKAVRDQNARLTDLKRTVQGRFFAGFDTEIRALSDRYFPMLKDQTGDIAGGFNAMGKNASKALLAPSSVKAVNTVLGSTKDTVRELEPALGNVLRGLLNLGGVGAQRAVVLGRAVTRLTADFDKWVASGLESGKINRLIDEGIDTAKDFGRVISNVGSIGRTVWTGLSDGGADFLDGLIETTQALEDFFKSAEGQRTLRELGETLGVTADVARDIFMTAMRELGPAVREVAPAVREVVSAVGEFLVGALETVGPMLQGTARFLSENKEAVGDLVPVLLSLALAYKGVRAAAAGVSAVAGLSGILGDVGKKADAAGNSIGDAKGGKGLAGKLNGLIGVAGAAAIIGLGIGAALDEVGQKADDVNKRLRFEITVGANTADAEIETKRLQSYVNKTSGTVNINGNDAPAAFALARVVDEISKGKGTVTLNGNEAPALSALSYLVDIINSESGTVRFNGNDTPAGQVLLDLIRRGNASYATIGLQANTSGAQGVIDSFIQRNDGRTVQIYTSVLGSGGLASAGRLATGGAVRGPGTGTSDTAGLFALSHGEHVLTAAEVRMLGGQGAAYRLRQMIRSGGLTGLADGGAVVPSFSRPMPWRSSNINVSATASAPEVRVFIGEREITEVVRVEIDRAERSKRRSARSGSGGAL